MTVKKLLSNGLLYSIGNILIQGMGFFTLPIYTRLMPKEAFGSFNLFLSWVSILAIILGCQTAGTLSIAKLKYASDYDAYSSHAMSVSLLISTGVGASIYVFSDFFMRLFSCDQTGLLMLVLQSVASYVLGFMGQYFIQKQEATKSLMISAITTFLTIVLSVAFLMTWASPFLARVMGLFISYALVSICSLFYLYRQSGIVFKREYLYATLSWASPLIFQGLGHVLLNQVDRVMIGHFLGIEEVALYSFGYSLGLIIQVILMSMTTVWAPWFFQEKKKKNSELSKISHYYIGIGLFLTLGYLTMFPEVSMIMGGKSYATANTFIPYIILAYFFWFLYTYPINIQYYHENTKLIPIGTLFATFVNYVLNVFLIPIYGIMGAAVATLLAYLALFLFQHGISKKVYHYTEVGMRQYVLVSCIAIGYAILMTLWISYPIYRYVSLGLISIGVAIALKDAVKIWKS